ncbi:MAG: PKD domain-containing protein [Acidobacteriota bacterium]
MITPGKAAFALIAVAGLVSCGKATPVAPSGTTVTLSVNPTRINIEGQATATAIVRRADGAPVNPGTIVNFSTSLGEVDPESAPTDDAGIATAVISGAGQIGMATVTASTGPAAPVSVELQIGSLASSMTLQASPTSVGQAGGQVDLLAVVRDDAGQLLKNLAVNFSTSTGTLESLGAAVLTNEKGEARDSLTVTEVDIIAQGEEFITVTAFAATTEGAALLEAATEINIRGLISSLSLQVTPGSVPQAGGILNLLALVKDDVGRGVANAPVNFITEAGTLASGGAVVQTDEGGQASDTLSVSADITGAEISAQFVVRVQTGAPIADFDFFPNGLRVTFVNQSTGDEPLSCSWDFGDSTTSQACNPPEHIYANPDTYSVRLTVTNTVGTDAVVEQVTVMQ